MPPTGSTVSISSLKARQLEEVLAKKQATLNSTPSVKYASARIKLLRTESNAKDPPFQLTLAESALKSSQQECTIDKRSSPSSTLCGYKNLRRLIELLINEFYRKRGQSYKLVSPDRQIPTLVDFWRQSLSRMKILGKLKNKLAKSGLAEKERHLLTFLDGTETTGLMKL